PRRPGSLTADLRSGSAETISLRIETTRPTFGQAHLSDRRPECARPPTDQPATAESRDEAALSQPATLLPPREDDNRRPHLTAKGEKRPSPQIPTAPSTSLTHPKVPRRI